MTALALIGWIAFCGLIALILYAFLNAAGSYDEAHEEREAEIAALWAERRQ